MCKHDWATGGQHRTVHSLNPLLVGLVQEVMWTHEGGSLEVAHQNQLEVLDCKKKKIFCKIAIRILKVLN